MRRLVVFFIVLTGISYNLFAQRDIEAWKNEDGLEQQFQVFKKNLNFWDGKYFMNEKQLNEYYRSISDSVEILKENITNKGTTIKELQDQLSATISQLNETKTDLETSIKNRNSIDMFGMNIDKGLYTLIISFIIIALIVLLLILYFMYLRSNKVTVRVKNDYDELKEEFEVHKKDALERYTKINMELHHTRLELKKK